MSSLYTYNIIRIKYKSISIVYKCNFESFIHPILIQAVIIIIDLKSNYVCVENKHNWHGLLVCPSKIELLRIIEMKILRLIGMPTKDFRYLNFYVKFGVDRYTRFRNEYIFHLFLNLCVISFHAILNFIIECNNKKSD